MRRVLLLLPLLRHAHADCGDASLGLQVDFAVTTNPSASLEWLNAAGTYVTGQTRVPLGERVFPEGYVRFKDVGTGVNNDGVPFDILVNVSSNPDTYAGGDGVGDSVNLRYEQLTLESIYAAFLTTNGYACLGMLMDTATCDAGSSLDPLPAQCISDADGARTATTMTGELIGPSSPDHSEGPCSAPAGE